MSVLRNCALLLCILLCLMVSCRQRHHHVNRSFYYWKTAYKPTNFELDALQHLAIQKIYIRLFDLEWNTTAQTVYPLAVLRMRPVADTTTQFVPVIFITQATLSHLQHNTDNIAARISSLAEVVCSESGIRAAELQIDCDWTANTREAYFALLTALKKQPFLAGKELSCTIRMHQIKYTTSSGIPPVSHGVLMCYNMGNTRKYGDHNSILDVATARKYLGGTGTYPLHLNIALPLFSWSVLFREKRFVGILREVTPEMIAGNSAFLKASGNLYQCLRDTVWNGYTLLRNDMVRTESTTVRDLNELAGYTSGLLPNDSVDVIYFSCDSLTLSKYSLHDLETVFDHYR